MQEDGQVYFDDESKIPEEDKQRLADAYLALERAKAKEAHVHDLLTRYTRGNP